MNTSDIRSWWLCPPDEFYKRAAAEAPRMRVEPLPPAVDDYFAEALVREERDLLQIPPRSRQEPSREALEDSDEPTLHRVARR